MIEQSHTKSLDQKQTQILSQAPSTLQPETIPPQQNSDSSSIIQDSQQDDIQDESDPDQQIKRPSPQKISEDECYKDDQIKDDDDIVDEQDSLIYDSQNEEEFEKKPEIEEKEAKEKQFKNKNKINLYDYQNILFNRSLEKNRIIYLPTGKGKTLVSIASMYYYLCKEGQNKKIVFLANTIQLVKQQADSIKRNLEKIMADEDLSNSLRKQEHRGKIKWSSDEIKQKVCCIHGQKNDQVGMTRRKKIQAELSSKKQIQDMFKKSTIIVMISQMFLNCLRRGYIKITDFSFMVFDQCHHCHGNHPYAGIMREFYFDPPKPDAQMLKRMALHQQEIKLPIIMGLTASPVMQESFDKDKLIKQIDQLCGNLNSRFTSYETDKIKSQTDIKIIKTIQTNQRSTVPDLIAHFQKFKDHRQSYDKIQKHFPKYFQFVKKVIDFLKSKSQKQFNLDVDPHTITQIQHLLFYDIKQCLLIKLRDVWLELGQYAFSIAFQQLYFELGKINLKNKQNQDILDNVKEIIGKHVDQFRKLYGKCQKKYFSAKVNQLINLLAKKKQQANNKFQMVVVFASKRRTVKYLDRIIKDYRQTLQTPEQKFNYQCDKVTGYSVKSACDYSNNQSIFEGDPSSHRFEAQVQRLYEGYQIQLQEQKSRVNKIHQGQGEKSQSKNLDNQIKRMKSVKYGKLLLEVQQKYSAQIQTIKKFRLKKFRVLVTTSVTEQGFDIPECKIVVSFDRPSSLKSYIQIKGRARQQYSSYYIFTNQRNHNQMVSNKNFYDDIINATFQIAINKFSDNIPQNQIKKKAAIISKEQGYKKIIIRQSGAVLNTSYALEILKMYSASLRQPNKLKFYFVETPNVVFKCVICFPKTAPTSKPYIVGQAKSNKHSALKSAAFQAVKYLYQGKYIKDDLRPKKYQQLQDEREIQKFEDLQQTRKNQIYKQIFQKDVRIKSQNVIDRKFMRFYFKTIRSSQLDFNKINPLFKKHVPKFEKQQFPFQIYMMNFNNSKNMKELRKDQGQHQIGVLTCFEQKYNQEVFSGYQYTFQQNGNQKFTMKLQQERYMLNRKQYEKLKKIHHFLMSSALSREVNHYSSLTNKKPFPPRWISQKQKSNQYYQESQRQFYPLIVILKKQNNYYKIDEEINSKIQAHENLFKQLYQFHNVSGKQQITQKFNKNLRNYREELSMLIKNNKIQGVLVQNIQKQHCFSKVIISGTQNYRQQMQRDKDKKRSLASKIKKLSAQFQHATQDQKQIVKIVFWNKYKKQKKKQIFQRQGKMTIKQVQNSKYYHLSEFCIFPLTASTLFKVTLATQFLFKAVFQYSLAFQFRNYKLTQIFNQKIQNNKIKQEKPFKFSPYQNVILENGSSIFKYLAQNSSSQYLRKIGKSYEKGTNFEKPSFQFSFSKFDQSSIMMQKQVMGQSMNLSVLGIEQIMNQNQNNSILSQKSFIENSQSYGQNLVSKLKITEILKVLTSRMYKFNKVDNYEEYQFIGDVVLKMLSTVQIFLQKTQADESQLHISRANIICNANLHRKSILKNIYRYILSKKLDELPPPYTYTPLQNIKQQFYEKTSIKIHNENSQLEGYHYIPGKVHADVIEGLIGAFYLNSRNLNDCQILLYSFDVLKKPFISINYDKSKLSQMSTSLPKLYSDFENRIEYHFRNKGLLVQALTHSSFKSILNTVLDKNNIKEIQKMNTSQQSSLSFMSINQKQFNKNISSKTVSWQTFYERLQFLGDSILDLIVVEYLHDKFGTKDQGTLSALKQAGVSNKTLGMIAISYGMHELILMDYPENDKVMTEFQKIIDNYDKYLNNPETLLMAKINSIKILGDVFEALVGAIFIDLQLDYNLTKTVIMKMIKDFLEHYTTIQNQKKSTNAKFHEYLSKNNYRECQLKKDVDSQIQNGNFRYLLMDRTGAIVDQCWQSTQKKAWDIILEKFYIKTKKESQGSVLK